MWDKSVIGRRLRARREQLGLRQDQVADKIGAEQPAISAIEGGRVPAAKTLVALAGALRCSVDYLLGATEDPDPPREAVWRLQLVKQKIREALEAPYPATAAEDAARDVRESMPPEAGQEEEKPA